VPIFVRPYGIDRKQLIQPRWAAAQYCSWLAGFFFRFRGCGGEADEGGYLFSTQTAEFRQVGDERCGDDRADAAHGAQDFGQAIELPIAGDVTLDRLFNQGFG
jgi:hypothetical protein